MTEKTTSQLTRLLHKIAAHFPANDDAAIMTDVHIRVNQETGDVMAFNDSDEELTRIVVDEWIENTDTQETFYRDAANEIRKLLYAKNEQGVENGQTLGIIMPYNFVLENELGEHIEELYIADIDNDMIVVGTPFMEGLSDELDAFINDLLKV